MRLTGKIITVGLCPCWDIVCRLDGIDWGGHEIVDSYERRPAGKALNISKALAWMGQKSTAAGLWGKEDYGQMWRGMKDFGDKVMLRMTAVEGRTRWNISVIDTAGKREMHLRNKSGLASGVALRKLKSDLGKIVRQKSACVFAGALPGGKMLNDAISVIDYCRKKGGRIVLDTSGAALKKIVRRGGLWVIKPNVEELRELAGKKVADRLVSLIKAARKLLNRAEIVLISRGRRGAVVVTKDGAWCCEAVGGGEALYTVGCGDYLLAGFLGGLKEKRDVKFALGRAVKVGTAKAWGLTEKKKWVQVEERIKIQLSEV